MSKIEVLAQQLKGLDPEKALAHIALQFSDKATLSTSFGIEDQVITHMIFNQNLFINVFTLDTGRLFNETYYTWGRVLERYNHKIDTYYPNTKAVEQLLSTKGPSSFYESVENRKECCFIRKVEPLSRALKGKELWITGIRKEQSGSRTDMQQLEWDEQHQVIKFHPLFNWTLAEVKDYVKKHNLTINPLHDKGFPSIGCSPCTRAVREGEDERAGRWWWEDSSKKECGLHTS
jgi:phosphoadenosine phosphosulfate reductase